jgi:TRAP-type C4-dicarboxylate transport system permease large subunit
MTEQSIGKLFMAGIVPGILLTMLFILAVIDLGHPASRNWPPGAPEAPSRKTGIPVRSG